MGAGSVVVEWAASSRLGCTCFSSPPAPPHRPQPPENSSFPPQGQPIGSEDTPPPPLPHVRSVIRIRLQIQHTQRTFSGPEDGMVGEGGTRGPWTGSLA